MKAAAIKNESLHWVNHKVEATGSALIYCSNIFRQMFKPPFRRRELFRQLYFIGNQSLSILLLTSFFTGGVFGLQIGGIFAIFRAEGMLGGATGLALAAELAPLVTGFLLTGRAGSAMTAEISTMVVNEEVEALESMGVDPIHYLVVPRVIASFVMMPILCGMFMFVGMFGCYVVGRVLFNVDEGVFWQQTLELLDETDLYKGLRKMFVFSFIISTFACIKGLKAKGGAKGVGQAVNSSVVYTLVCLLITDFVMSYLELRWLS